MSQPAPNVFDCRLLRRSEVAAAFGVDPRTVGEWATKGRLQAVRTPSGERRYRETDVRALLEGATSPPGTSLSDEDAGLGERDEP